MEQIIANPTTTKKILNKYNFNLKKKLGQNMLVDPNILDRMIGSANLAEDDTVIEIGSGIGSLTQKILAELNSGYLIAVEKDNKFIKILKDIFEDADQLEIINQDIRDIDWNSFLNSRELNSENVKIMGNLPYYITTPIIMDLLENDVTFNRLVFMVQKEVAERIVANPGTKDFGALSVAAQFYSKPKLETTVSPEVFIPQPRVHSSIVTFQPYLESPFKVDDKEFFFKVVKAIFQLRRKNIKNSLTKASVIDLSKDTVIQGLKECGIDRRIRGEKLSIEKMVYLSNVLNKILESSGYQ